MNHLILMNKQYNHLEITIIIVIVVLIFGNCDSAHSIKSRQSNANQIKQDTTDTYIQLDTTSVKIWLEKVIVDYVRGSDLNLANQNLTLALTDEYYNYKHEAITLEYSDMTLEEFNRKWESKYDIKYVGNSGFFGLPPDHGEIEVISCFLLQTYEDSTQIYRVVIRDILWETNHLQDIKIVRRNQKLLIDDIIE